MFSSKASVICYLIGLGADMLVKYYANEHQLLFVFFLAFPSLILVGVSLMMAFIFGIVAVLSYYKIKNKKTRFRIIMNYLNILFLFLNLLFLFF